MDRSQPPRRALARAGFGLALATFLFSAGADGAPGTGFDFETTIAQPARRLASQAAAWYERTPSADRITWGGLGACAVLGLMVLFERMIRLRRRRVVPRDFVNRFLARIQEGKLDRGKALDFCELNPSPAARVALGAVRRWERPAIDQERAVGITCRVESDRLRRNVGTLRRIAAMAPLIGLLGSLFSASRTLAAIAPGAQNTPWGPALATALAPLTAGVALAIIALVAYDGLMGKIEAMVETLERIGAETVDAIAMATPTESRVIRTPHSIRVEVPEPHIRTTNRGADFDRTTSRATDFDRTTNRGADFD